MKTCMCHQLYFLLFVGSEIITIAVAYDSMLTQSADLGFISLLPFLTHTPHCPILPSPHPSYTQHLSLKPVKTIIFGNPIE